MEARRRTQPSTYVPARTGAARPPAYVPVERPAQPQKKKRRKKTIRRRYILFCRAHNFTPFKMTAALVIILVLVIFGGIGTVKTITSRTLKLGLENIGELATQVGYYTNVQVISSSREVFGIDVPFTQNKYVFSYDGIVKAGIDFEQVKVDVNELQKRITVSMPEVRVLSNEIDEESLEVYDETKNIFNPLKLDDVNLSLIELKQQSEATSIENGLLENARDNAELLIRGFLEGSFDLQKYEIVFEPPHEGA